MVVTAWRHGDRTVVQVTWLRGADLEDRSFDDPEDALRWMGRLMSTSCGDGTVTRQSRADDVEKTGP